MKSKSTISAKTMKMAQTAILIAIILLLGQTPIGYPKVGVVEMSLLAIPVTVGAILHGPATGALLGAIFGLTSFSTCIGAMPITSPLGIALFGISPTRTFVMCVLPRILMGWLVGLIFAALRKTKLNTDITRTVSCLAGPVLNTLLFSAALILLFGNSEFTSEYGGMAGFIPVWIGWIGINAVIEAIVCTIIAFAVTRALVHFNNRLK